MKNIFILASFVLSFSSQLKSQDYRIGAGLGVINFSTLGTTAIANLRAFGVIDESMSMTLNFNYNFPYNLEETSTAYARNSFTTPQSVNAKLVTEFKVLNLNLAYNYNIINTNDDPFQLYGLLGCGLSYTTTNTKIDNIDTDNYKVNHFSYAKENVAILVDLGIGANYLSNSITFFGETRLGVPNNLPSLDENEETNKLNIYFVLGACYSLF